MNVVKASAAFILSIVSSILPKARMHEGKQPCITSGPGLFRNLGVERFRFTHAISFTLSDTSMFRKAALTLAAQVAVWSKVDDVRGTLVQPGTRPEQPVFFENEFVKHSQDWKGQLETKRTGVFVLQL